MSWQTTHISQFAVLFLINICFEMFLIKVLDQMRFSSKCSIKCVSHRRLDQELSCFTKNTSFLFFERYKQFACHNTSFSLCQCECDLSEVINFCFTWITHETCDNERIQTSKVVVIAYFIFKFLICFCSITHWSDSRIRALSILLLATNESLDKIVSDFIVVCNIMFLNMLSCNRLVDRLRNWCIIQYYCFLLIGDHVWCTIENRNEITRKTSFSLSEIDRILYFLLKIIRARNTFFSWKFFVELISLYFLQLKISRKTKFSDDFCIAAWIASKWFEKSLWLWFSHLTNSNCSICLQRSSQICQTDNCFWIFSLNDFFLSDRLSCLLKFRWYYGQNSLWTCCVVLSVSFFLNDLADSNCCRIAVKIFHEHASSTLKNSKIRIEKSSWQLLFFLHVKFCLFFNMRLRVKSTEIFCVDTCNLVQFQKIENIKYISRCWS